MPPVRRSLEVIGQEILTLDLNVKQHIEAVQSCRESEQQLNQLAQIVKQLLRELDGKIDEYESVIRLRHKSDAAQLLEEVSQHRETQSLNWQHLRQAQLVALQAIEAENRASLLHGGSSAESGARRRNRMQMDNVLKQSSHVTDNLASLLRQIDQQVKQSESTVQSLVVSSETLGETEVEYRSTGAAIQSSGKLLSKYGRREFTDKVLIVLALALYCATVFYVVKKRLWGSAPIPQGIDNPTGE